MMKRTLSILLFLLICSSCEKQLPDVEMDSAIRFLENPTVKDSVKIIFSKNTNLKLSRVRNHDPQLYKLIASTSTYDAEGSIEILQRIAKDLEQNTFDYALLLYYLGEIDYQQGKIINAFDKYYHSQKLLSNLDNREVKVDVLIAISNLHLRYGDFVESEKQIRQVLNLALELNLTHQIFECYLILSENLAELSKLDQAHDFATKAKKIVNSYPDKFTARDLVLSNELLADSYKNLNELESALTYYVESRRFVQSIPESYRVQLKISEINLLLGRSDNFLATINALDFKNINFVDKSAAIAKLQLSQFYEQLDKQRALVFAREAYDISKKENYFELQRKALYNVIRLDSIDAQEYAQEFLRITEKIEKQDRDIRTKCARIAFETDELVAERHAADQKMKKATGRAVVSISSFFLLIIVVRQSFQLQRLLSTKRHIRENSKIYDIIKKQKIQLSEERFVESNRIAKWLNEEIVVRLKTAREKLQDLKDDPNSIRSSSLLDEFHEVERDVRQLSHRLNEDIFLGGSSFNTILQQVTDTEKIDSTEILFDVQKSLNWDLVESSVKMNIVKIYQILLQNVIRYSKPQHIFITISYKFQNIQVVIIEDGKGYINKWGRGRGSTRLAIKRANSLHGSVDIQTRVGKGTTIIVNLPLSHQIPTYGHEDQYYYC